MSFDDLQFQGLDRTLTVPVRCPGCFRIVDVTPDATVCPLGHPLPAHVANPLMSQHRPEPEPSNRRRAARVVDPEQAIQFPGMNEMMSQLMASLQAGGDGAPEMPEGMPGSEYFNMLMAQNGLNVDDLIQSLLNEPSYNAAPTSKAYLATLKPQPLLHDDFVQFVLRFKGVDRHIQPTVGQFGTGLSLIRSHPSNDASLKSHFSLKLIRSDPFDGSRIDNAADYSGSDAAAFMVRGKVSFVDKSRNVMKAGARAAVIVQTGDEWPFMMKDTANTGGDITIPCFLISSVDGDLVEKSMSKQGSSVEAISFWRELMCPVCREDFTVGEEAIRLPCKHPFHHDCISGWLQQRSVCPLCRYELPTEGSKGEEAKLRAAEQSQLREAMFT